MNERHVPGVVLVALVLVNAATSVQAHHSFSGAFDIDKRATLQGVLSKIDRPSAH